MSRNAGTGSGARVRAAAPIDVATLVNLMREFYAESGYALDEPWAARAFVTLLADPSQGAVWIVERDDAPIGHVVLSIRFAMEFGGLLGYIDDLYVRPGDRGVGAAGAALRAVVEDCRRRGCRAIEVEVSPDNAPAQSVYRRLGMVPGADRRQHLRMALPTAR
jgi:ribosomal protein S18 acetylase RimI-like enzyme